MRIFTTFALLALSICSGILTSSAKGKDIVLATAFSMPYVSTPDAPGFLSLIAQEMFSRIGHNVAIVRLPGERALEHANSGIEDGDLLRIGNMEKAYTNLVPVPEPLMVLEFTGYTLAGNSFPVRGWQSLQPYSVGIIIGWKIYERNVKEVAIRTDVRNMKLLFGLLKNRRADVVMADRWQGAYVGRQLGIDLDLLQPPFAETDMFMYLHKKHEDLARPLATALVEMKKDGTYQRIRDLTLGQFESIAIQ